MDSGKNDFEVTIKEALHIKFKKPTINRQLISDGSSFVLNEAIQVKVSSIYYKRPESKNESGRGKVYKDRSKDGFQRCANFNAFP